MVWICIRRHAETTALDRPDNSMGGVVSTLIAQTCCGWLFLPITLAVNLAMAVIAAPFYILAQLGLVFSCLFTGCALAAIFCCYKE